MKRPQKLDWTDAMIARLTALQATLPAISYAGMAEILSREFDLRLSKNALIGKARRLGLPGRKPAVIRTATPKPHKSCARHYPATPPDPPTPKINRGWTVALPAEPPGTGRITIYQLQDGVCHFPFGRHPPYAYCGRATQLSSSWCPYHEHVVYPRGPRR
jgi:hypothetical protein